MEKERKIVVKIICTNLSNVFGREILQNSTRRYVVFGSVTALEAFAYICESMLTDETDLEKIDNRGAHFVIADYSEQPFLSLVSRYGLQTMIASYP